MDVISLYKEHNSFRKVCEITGLSRNTVKRIIKNKHAPKNNSRNRKSKLEPYFDYIKERFEKGLSAHLIHQEVVKMGFLLDFSQYYGFSVKTCRPYRPRTKGKVERLINYIKGNFLPGKNFASIEDANAQARGWLVNVSNNRIHSTTGKKPCDLLAKEALVNHRSLKPFDLISCSYRKVSTESYIHYLGNKYSAPPEVASKIVTVEHLGDSIKVFSKDRLIVEHVFAQGKGKTIAKDEHIEQMWKLTSSQPPYKPKPKSLHKFEENVNERALSVYEEVLA